MRDVMFSRIWEALLLSADCLWFFFLVACWSSNVLILLKLNEGEVI